MAADEQETPAAESSPSKLGKLLPLILVVAGLLVGGVSGKFLVGPAVARAVTNAPKPAAEHEEGKGEKGKETAKQVYPLDNIVLNPAESGGTRFLLLSVAFETTDATMVEEMKTRDAELRDAVLVALGSKTVEQLSDMRLRDAMKAEVAASAQKLFKKKSALRVYFPQFVIQ